MAPLTFGKYQLLK